MSQSRLSDQDLAQLLHAIYEQTAESFGYETRTDTREFDPESPNGKTMISAVGQLREVIETQMREEIESQEIGLKDYTLQFQVQNEEEEWVTGAVNITGYSEQHAFNKFIETNKHAVNVCRVRGPQRYIIVFGGPGEGFEFYGPWSTSEEACRIANDDPRVPNDWWVVPLNCDFDGLMPEEYTIPKSDEEVTHLSPEDAERFAQALLRPSEPNENLRKAIERSRNWIIGDRGQSDV